jgi:hypothetical protein
MKTSIFILSLILSLLMPPVLAQDTAFSHNPFPHMEANYYPSLFHHLP